MPPSHLYVHVPFCARRCSYCDFAIAVRSTVPVDEYLRSVDAELDLRHRSVGPWSLRTIYLGGGTPSRLGGEGVARLLASIQTRACLEQGAEVTIEVNPDDVTPDAARCWRAAGINRVSVGAQSFDDRALRWMHRSHDAGAIEAAFETLTSAGFNDVSLDLIFALPTELNRNWRNDIERAVALGPTHVSLYGLTVEAHAPLGRWIARGEAAEAPEETYETEFLLADQMLGDAGYEHYEVSNFAKPGHRARQNSAYWLGSAYAGVGPGAHEFAPPERRWNVRAYSEWVQRLTAGQSPMDSFEVLTDENRIAEAVYLGLRTVDGLLVASAEVTHIQPWVDAGWATVKPTGRLVLTAPGWLRLDSLAADLTLFRSR